MSRPQPRRSKRPSQGIAALALAGAGLLLAAACGSTKGSAASQEALEPAEPVLVEVDFSDLLASSYDGRVARMAPARVVRDAAQGPVITLRNKSGLVVDLSALELRGQRADDDIDEASGVGILIEDCEDVTLKGGLVGGYKVCVRVVDSTGVRIEGMRFDGWYGARLRSTAFTEDLSDWIYPHENDSGEWEREYGGAISATDCRSVTIAGCRGRRGQNGILLTRCGDSEVYDNDFSFLSGWGLGMYRSSDNVVSHNIFDYCVRGYSHDVYWRGQDSAGILMFEGCARNVVAKNSATHSGDGIFLYAGNDLVVDGDGDAIGSDENLFWDNDLRFSVANAVEATFSRGNVVIANDLSCAHQHGVWGGYSSEMVIVDNRIHDVRGPAITIEHGQDCVIADNHIEDCEVGVEAYWDEDPELVGGPFGRIRATDSLGHLVVYNDFVDNVLDFVVRGTTALTFHGNTYEPGTREPYFEDIRAESDPSLDTLTVQRWLDALDGAYPSGNFSSVTLDPWTGRIPVTLQRWRDWDPPTDLPGGQVVRAEERGAFKGGLESIVIGEWGPWDLRSGAPRPERRRPGGLLEEAEWDALWFTWQKGLSDPRTQEAEFRARAESPLVEQRVANFVNPWATEEIRRVVGNDLFGLFATTRVKLPADGVYELSTTTDDGVRVYIDDELVIEDWTLHAATRDVVTMPLAAGEHTIRLEYFQIQGGAALVVELRAAD